MAEEWRRLGHLKSEDKVQMCIDMTDVCVNICASGIRSQYPGISEEELLEELRLRLQWAKRKR
jgi:hypothetical protein